jgi:hypothetical protein
VLVLAKDSDGNIIRAAYPIGDTLFRVKYVAVSAHRPRRKEIAKYLKPVLGKYVWNMRGYFNLKLLFREPHLY